MIRSSEACWRHSPTTPRSSSSYQRLPNLAAFFQSSTTKLLDPLSLLLVQVSPSSRISNHSNPIFLKTLSRQFVSISNQMTQWWHKSLRLPSPTTLQSATNLSLPSPSMTLQSRSIFPTHHHQSSNLSIVVEVCHRIVDPFCSSAIVTRAPPPSKQSRQLCLPVTESLSLHIEMVKSNWRSNLPDRE